MTAVVVATAEVKNRQPRRKSIRKNIIAMTMMMTMMIRKRRKILIRIRTKIKIRVIAKRNSRLTGLKLLSSVPNVLSKISRRQPIMLTTL